MCKGADPGLTRNYQGELVLIINACNIILAGNTVDNAG